MVLSPVLIPTGVHACHGIANWRQNYELLRAIIGRKWRAVTAADRGKIYGRAWEELPALRSQAWQLAS
ncbi:MAG TPA: hypothetical protein VLL82_04500 [Mycobacterium sp.]|nr:hypothetical protein [Mycobacterium sp.]